MEESLACDNGHRDGEVPAWIVRLHLRGAHVGPTPKEDAITEHDLRASWEYAETFLPEAPAAIAARDRARDSGVAGAGERPEGAARMASLRRTLAAKRGPLGRRG